MAWASLVAPAVLEVTVADRGPERAEAGLPVSALPAVGVRVVQVLIIGPAPTVSKEAAVWPALPVESGLMGTA